MIATTTITEPMTKPSDSEQNLGTDQVSKPTPAGVE